MVDVNSWSRIFGVCGVLLAAAAPAREPLTEADWFERDWEQQAADISEGELRLLALPAVEFSVAGATAAGDESALTMRQWALSGLLAALLAVLAWLAYRLLPALPWRRVSEPLRRALEVLRQLRKPALPTRLNPDSSAGD